MTDIEHVVGLVTDEWRAMRAKLDVNGLRGVGDCRFGGEAVRADSLLDGGDQGGVFDQLLMRCEDLGVIPVSPCQDPLANLGELLVSAFLGGAHPRKLHLEGRGAGCRACACEPASRIQ